MHARSILGIIVGDSPGNLLLMLHVLVIPLGISGRIGSSQVLQVGVVIAVVSRPVIVALVI